MGIEFSQTRVWVSDFGSYQYGGLSLGMKAGRSRSHQVFRVVFSRSHRRRLVDCVCRRCRGWRRQVCRRADCVVVLRFSASRARFWWTNGKTQKMRRAKKRKKSETTLAPQSLFCTPARGKNLETNYTQFTLPTRYGVSFRIHRCTTLFLHLDYSAKTIHSAKHKSDVRGLALLRLQQ